MKLSAKQQQYVDGISFVPHQNALDIIADLERELRVATAPDPGKGYDLIIAEDMPGDDFVPKGIDYWHHGAQVWTLWCSYERWGGTNVKYFRRRIVPAEPKTFADEYGDNTQQGAAREVAFVDDKRILEGEAVDIMQFYEDGRWVCYRHEDVLRALLLGKADMSKLRWKPKD